MSKPSEEEKRRLKREYQRQYCIDHPDRVLASRLKYLAKNADRKRELNRAWREKNKKRMAMLTQEWRNENPDRYHANQKRYRENHPERPMAWMKTKRVPRPSTCSICGLAGKIVAHHPDYAQPAFVLMICERCHYEIHYGRGESCRA